MARGAAGATHADLVVPMLDLVINILNLVLYLLILVVDMLNLVIHILVSMDHMLDLGDSDVGSPTSLNLHAVTPDTPPGCRR
jgi:hypothetical protein